MGRPGGGGGRSSGGHSGGGRSSGGHSMGGSRPGGSFGGSRPGGGAGRGGARPGGAGPGGPMRGPGVPGGPRDPWGPGRRPPRRGWFGRFFYRPWFGYGGYGGRGGCGCLTTIIIVLFIMVIGVMSLTARGCTSSRSFWFSSNDNSGSYSSDASDISGNYTSDTAREKADTGVAFSDDCVLDELGWVEDSSATGKALESFYEETGVQPYVYLKAYDASMSTDSEKLAYAEDWYDENISNEGTFLYIYFAEEDSDNDMGYMAYVCGEDAVTVMDDEAVEIFWNYLDDYWYTNLSMDDVLVETFDATANAIMN